jgi:hypothetical protein
MLAPAFTLALAAAGASGCASEIVLPDPPREAEVNMVAAIYDNPTGTIDVANIEAKLDDVQARIDQIPFDWLPTLIAEGLQRFAKRLDDANLTSDTQDGADTTKRTVIDAIVDMKRICRGWSDTPGLPDEAANGALTLTGVVEDGTVRSDLWGSATACKTRLDPADVLPGGLTITPSPSVNLSLEGTLDVRLYGPLPRALGDAKFLLIFSGRLGTDVRSVDTSFDFRVLDGQLAFRYAVSDGDVIIEVGVTSISVRGANGSFSCDLTSRSCQ